MKRALSAMVTMSLLSIGCATAPTPEVASQDTAADPPIETGPSTTETTTEEAPAATDDTSGALETARAESSDTRRTGDYVTFQFRGTSLSEPVRLTQRVTARDSDTLTVDFTFTGERPAETLRVRTSLVGQDVRSVERVLADGSVRPATIADFEARMTRTVAIADENEALISERRRTLKVGARQLETTETAYRVRVGAKAATLRTLTADDFSWGDAGGEIVTADGKVLYRAELVDMGGGPAPVAALDVDLL